MQFYLGITDIDWFGFLSQIENEDINFWRPDGKSNFKALKPGAPFVFKLKSPANAVGGVAFFSSYSILPLEVAWNIFQQRNGVASYFELRNKIISNRRSSNAFDKNPNIGCIVLTDPIFFNKEDWIEIPGNWKRSTQRGKIYNTNDSYGQNLWQQIEDNLKKYRLFERPKSYKSQFILEDPSQEYTNKYLTKVRLGQGAFRVQLTDLYSRRCPITGEKTLPALEAAHIKPYSESGPHYLSNGILMRADFHRLFDSGYITLNSRHQTIISNKIKEQFENGREYYKYHGKEFLFLPENPSHQPRQDYIEWHQNNIFKG